MTCRRPGLPGWDFTKAFAIDGERLVVGSYNLDPRSTSLNCEQGVLLRGADFNDDGEIEVGSMCHKQGELFVAVFELDEADVP